MKTVLCLTVLLLMVPLLMAEEPVRVSFNLVQVNHYAGQEQLLSEIVTPGPRVIVDVRNPEAVRRFVDAAQPAVRYSRQTVVVHESIDPSNLISLPWESSRVVYSASGLDSFLVSSSRSGCPGTEVRPSVAVAFESGLGWSDPPIRFGPLSENTVCPLGKGYVLAVRLVGDGPPLVGVRESAEVFGFR